MGNKKIIIGVSIIFFVGLGIWGYSFFFTGDSITREEQVSVVKADKKFLAVTEDFPPFAFEEDGVVKGIDIDIFDLAMQRVGVPYEVKIVPWARALKMVKEGEAESILIASYTDERDDWAYFTEKQRMSKNEILPDSYLGAHDMVFFIRTILEDSLRFESFNQIREDSSRIGLDASYAYADSIIEAGWNTKYYNNVNENFIALNNGEVDMYLADKAVGLWVIEEMGLQDEITYIDKPVFTFVYLAPFSKNSDYPNLKEIWDQVTIELEKIQESGEYDEIYRRYTE